MAAAGALWVKGVSGVETLATGAPLGVPGTPVPVHTPGHTAGHCALHLTDRDTLLCGDALVTLDPYTGRRGPQIVAVAATADSAEALRSLEALATTGARTLLTGHGAPWHGGPTPSHRPCAWARTDAPRQRQNRRRAMTTLGRFLAPPTAAVGLGLVVLGMRLVNGRRYPQGPRPPGKDPNLHDTEQPGVTVTRVADGPLHGFHLKPDAVRRRGVVVTFGGSEGGPDYDRAVALAKDGHEVLALFFFGMPGQPRRLSAVPVDFFDAALAYAERHAASARPLTVVGTSKGAELALVLSQLYSSVDNVVVYAPTTHVWQGLDPLRPASSWTFQGRPLPYVSFERASPEAGLHVLGGMVLNYPVSHRATYETALANSPDADAARIRLDRLRGHLLAFAGDADRLWPGEVAVADLERRRPERTEGVVYAGAGHVFGLPGRYAAGLDLGGAAEANAWALADSQRRLLAALAEWHR